MKNILFCFSIALAMLVPASVHALNRSTAGDIKNCHTENSVIQNQVSNSIQFFDTALLDLSSDDDLNDSERKKSSTGKTGRNNTSFILQHFLNKYHKSIAAFTSFISLRTSLFIFIGQFRL